MYEVDLAFNKKELFMAVQILYECYTKKRRNTCIILDSYIVYYVDQRNHFLEKLF